MKNDNATRMMVAMIVSAAGVAAPIFAQTQGDRNDPATTTTRQNDRPGQATGRDNQNQTDKRMDHGQKGKFARMPGDLRSADWLLGREVVNANDEDIADVTDLVIDRGSGRVSYAIVTSGTILGMGGRRVAIPFHSLQWDAEDEEFVLNTTADDLRDAPEFTTEEWRAVTDPNAGESASPLRERLDADSRYAAGDPFQGRLTDGEQVRIEGEVVSIDRQRWTQWPHETPTGRSMNDQGQGVDAAGNQSRNNLNQPGQTDAQGNRQDVAGRHGDYAAEHTILTIRTDDGQTQRVALGPSWYVSSQAMVPMRGDRVAVQGVKPAAGRTGMDNQPAARQDQDLIVATSIRAHGRDVTYRDDRYAAAWSGGPAGDQAGQADRRGNTLAHRNILLSSLDGAKVSCRALDCGKIDDIVIDRANGEIVFLSIDPDRNVLGIGDTKRLVPWTVASIGADGIVRIDASKDMVLNSPETPDDVSTLGSGGQADRVYQIYQVNQPSYLGYGQQQGMRNTTRDDRGMTPTGRQNDRDNRTAAGNQNQAASGDLRQAWAPNGFILTNLDRNSLRTISGEVEDVRTEDFGNDVPDAKAVVIDTGSGEAVVLLGPAEHFDNKDKDQAPCKEGDTATVTAYRVTIDGKPYWIARSIESGGKSVTLINDAGGAAWANR